MEETDVADRYVRPSIERCFANESGGGAGGDQGSLE